MPDQLKGATTDDRDPFLRAVQGPRPAARPVQGHRRPAAIGWISTRDGQGRVNLAPYSYFNAFSDVPPIVGFTSDGRKDSLRNAEQTGEFVANLATQSLAEAMNLTSAAFPMASTRWRWPA